MLKRTAAATIALLVISALSLALHPAGSGLGFGYGYIPGYAQSGCQTFQETGKEVCGVFLLYWQGHGGLAQQGFPISGEMQERSDTDGKLYTVQYFERAVFEKHPEKQAPYDVLLSLLGRFAYAQKYPAGAPGQTVNTEAGSVLFSQTGHHLGGKFLEYWSTHGGLAQQGFPISDEFSEISALDGKSYTVQYFERAVFEKHPEKAPPYDILLSQLGTFRYQAIYVAGGGGGSGSGGSGSGGSGGNPTPGPLPELATKPPVPLNTYGGCPSVGDGGDPQLNIRKNRTDPAPWYPVSLSAIATLQWPQAIGGRPRSAWSAADSDAVARYEGVPVQVEGYLAGAKTEGPESPNCHSISDVDNHLWLVDDASQDRSHSLVTEITPRVRAMHVGWSIGNLTPLVGAHTRVRIRGWLMMDQEHTEQIGLTRATLWEIHPIVGFEALRNGEWVSLDTLGGLPVPTPAQPASTPIGNGQPTPQPPATQPPQPPPSGTYQATASVSDPNPAQNSSVTVTAVLTRGGVGVAGATMVTSWHYKSVTSQCGGTSGSDGVASCARDIGRATSGYRVVIDVVFTAPDGTSVSTSTAFTPR